MSEAPLNGGAGPSHSPDIVVHSHRTPHPFFTPTHVRFSDSSKSNVPTSEWNSRRARKGRYQRTDARLHGNAQGGTPPHSTRLEKGLEREIVGRVKREESKLKPGLRLDISWWEAVSFTFGSAVWVVNGFTVWFPILRPPLDTTTFSYTAAGLAFVGGTVFEIGSYLMVVEALDRGREINFGTALGQLLHHRRTTQPNEMEKLDQGQNPGSPPDASPKSNGMEGKGNAHDKDVDLHTYIWWGKPMWHDLGYCAAIVQLFAATVFWISTLTGLPGVIPGFFSDSSSKAIVDIFFWTPQVIGGSGFIVSSLILMLEVQHAWWKIKPLDIGWHVGFWNLIGAIGFTLCGALGYSSSSACEYQSALSTFWGSWAFLIGSGCQIWEVIWREPS